MALAGGFVPLLVWLPGFVEQVENGRYSWVAGFDALKAAAVYSTYFWNADDLYVESERSCRSSRSPRSGGSRSWA